VTEPDSDSSRANPLARILRSPWLWVPLALLIALRAILPFALERAIPWLAKREAGADLTIENIDLGLLGGRFRIEGLRIANPLDSARDAMPEPSPAPEASPAADAKTEPGGAAAAQTEPESESELLALARLDLEIDWLALLKRDVSLARIQLDGLTLRLHQNRDGSIALPAVPARDANEHAEAVEADARADSATGWPLRIAHFELNDPDLALYSERTGSEVAHLTLTRFAVEALRSGPAGFGLDEIALEDPDVFVDRDWLFDPGFARSANESPQTESRPPALQIARLVIDSGHFRIRSPQGPIESAIRIEILRFDTAPGHTFPISIALEVGDGAASLEGLLGIFPPTFEGELAWRELRVSPYMALAAPAVVPWLASCNAGGRVELSFHSEQPARLAFRGESRLSDLAFRQPETGELAFEAKQVAIQIRDALLPLAAGQPQHLELASVSIAKPKVVFTNPPDALDELLASFSKTPANAESTADERETDEAAPRTASQNESPSRAKESDSSFEIQIDALKVSDGELVFVDRSVEPRHETRVRNFRLDAADLSSPPAGAARIEMAGVIQRKGTFEIQGKLPGGNGTLRVKVRRLGLAGYEGFARKAGLHVDSGDASLDSKIQIRDGNVAVDNDLLLHDLRIDSTNPSAFTATFGISLDVALALLRGPRGDIELALPLTIGKRGTGVGLASLIRSAIQEALKGALTAPLKIVGGLLPRGSQPASLEPIEFEPGAVELSASARKRIASLIDLLKDRPELGFALSGQSAAVDERSLALAVLQDRAVAGEGLPALEGAGFFARRRLASALRERAEGGEGRLEPADEALLARYVDVQKVPTQRYDALATARAQAVANALSAAGAPEGALTIVTPETADAPGVVVELTLRALDQPASPE